MDASNAQFSMPAFQMNTKSAAREKFSILLVGPPDLSALLRNEIFSANGSTGYQMNIHTSELVEDIVKSSQQCHADFIAFLIDPRDNSAVEMVERSISLLEPLFMCSRICLINCYDVSPLEMADAEQILNLVDKFSVLIMHGDLQNEATRNFLAKRVLYLSSSVCGFKTGLPLVFDLPTSKIVK